MSGIVNAQYGTLVVVEERGRRIGRGRALGVQVDDAHQWRHDEGVAQRRRGAVAHRERVRRQWPVPVRVLVPKKSEKISAQQVNSSRRFINELIRRRLESWPAQPTYYFTEPMTSRHCYYRYLFRVYYSFVFFSCR